MMGNTATETALALSDRGGSLKSLDEAIRVEEQAKNSWSALRVALGERYDAFWQQARQEAESDLGPLDASPRGRLSLAYAMLTKAAAHRKALAGQS